MREVAKLSDHGLGRDVLKEKIKKLKEDIKIWNNDSFGDLDKRIMARREEISKMDLIDEVLGLDE